ncbi:MAG: hypothetical protein Kow0029_10210 [Candidatus Rifleibacteriota bacterium]
MFKKMQNLVNNRKGIVIFVVLGGIFVLTILVLSYNYLVQGKFNENREILSHIRAMKCAQAIARYIVEKMKADLKDVNSVEKDSPGNVLRTKVFVENDPDKLAEKIQSAWLEKINFADLTQKLFGKISTKNVAVSAEVAFKDLIFLKDLKKEGELFLDFEKAGKMRISVEVSIGETREEWLEERPFRVVVPYPIPLTKFSLYLREATTDHDPTKFNTVSIDSATTGSVAPGSPVPFIIDNGLQGDTYNRQADIWKRRGWIYLGGGRLLLNRAGGGRNYGQRYHSYFPDANMPIALILQFPDFNGVQVGNKTLGFRMARWGFSNSLINGPSAAMWRKILAWQMRQKPPDSEKKWWKSTFLHLFGEVGRNSSDKNLSITRVCGEVYDRFIEIGYLVPVADGEPPIGAVIGSDKDLFDQNTGKAKKKFFKKDKDAANSFITDTWVDKNLIYLPAKPDARLGVPDLREMESFFETLPYSSKGGISFDQIMSRADYCSYHESYNMIAQYSQNSQNINIPPLESVPKIDENKFLLDVMGLKTANLEISKIAPDVNPSLGMEKRVCYEIKAQGNESPVKLLKESFCNPANNDFQFGNAVVKVVTGGKGLTLMDNLGAETGGTLIVDGPFRVGTFRKAASAENAPLVLMAAKGAIEVKNNGQHPTLAYLIALEKGKGEIKVSDERSPLNLIGGIAAHTIDPDKIKAGGRLYYNQSLDPTSDVFGRYLGVVIGPSGGSE